MVCGFEHPPRPSEHFSTIGGWLRQSHDGDVDNTKDGSGGIDGQGWDIKSKEVSPSEDGKVAWGRNWQMGRS